MNYQSIQMYCNVCKVLLNNLVKLHKLIKISS